MKKSALLASLLLISTIAAAQLQNTSFENWELPVETAIDGNRPVGWIRTNGVPGSEFMNFRNDPVTEAQQGDYALRLSIWYTYDKDMAIQTAPINYRPTALTGFYTYTDNLVYDPMVDTLIDDVASVRVRLTRTDPSSGAVMQIGSGLLHLNAAASFAPFSCAIEYTSEEIPDQIEVLFDCSRMIRSVNGIIASESSGWASYFTVDNIALTGETLNANEVRTPKIQIYPNPAHDYVFVPGFEGEARIYGLSGNLVRQSNIQDGKLDLRNLPDGTYFLSLRNGKTQISKTLIKK